jgi:GPI-anchor transamidase subunit K
VQDHAEISAQDVAEAIAEMYAQRRYKNLFVVLETCQAATMFARVTSPGVFLLAASKKGEHHCL